MITGRFAPTPSGPLHFGSLVTAVASYCQTKSSHGEWMLRIEDLDTPRVVDGSADDILYTLEIFGFEWDGKVLYQSKRFEIYEQIVRQLIHQDVIYACTCSRKSLISKNLHYGPLGLIYPAYCRHKNFKLKDLSLRLNLEQAGAVLFTDRHYGPYKLDLKNQVGDIVLKRIDGVYAYHLAVVVDDAYQQINDIVRGVDLLEATCLHLYLNQLLGLPHADYLHIPLIRTPDGKKLSKQTGAKRLDNKKPREQILSALAFLGQDVQQDMTDMKPQDILNYACLQWDSGRIPRDSLESTSPS